jgi:hypothetical protein
MPPWFDVQTIETDYPCFVHHAKEFPSVGHGMFAFPGGMKVVHIVSLKTSVKTLKKILRSVK